jgi:YgiT-type zinc finger domain-containing protein
MARYRRLVSPPEGPDLPPTAPSICELCGKEGVTVRRVAETFGKGNNVFVIDDIPKVECPHCGKSYFTAETQRKIERMKAEHRGKA